MIFVAQLAGRERFEFDVVLDVRCAQNDGLWTRELEQAPLESVESCWIKMLDNFQHCRCLESGQASVAIGKRTV